VSFSLIFLDSLFEGKGLKEYSIALVISECGLNPIVNFC
jgi:hypothetical protein